jgi:hypothetical protein
VAKIPNPTSRNSVTKSGRRLIIFAKDTAKNDWKPIMNTAPKTKNKAFRLPYFRFTFAAVILINPGGIIPMHAVIKPKNRVEISLLTSFG